MKTKNKIKIKAKNTLRLKSYLMYSLGIGSIGVALALLLSLSFNVGFNLKSNANNAKETPRLFSKSAGDWNNPKVWQSNSKASIPTKNMDIEIQHTINCSGTFNLTGTIAIRESGKLIADEIIVEKGSELFIEGEFYVNNLILKKGCMLNLNKGAVLVVYEKFINDKNSDQVYIDGELHVFGDYFNKIGAEVYGDGNITVSGNFEGEGLEYSISPLVKIIGNIEQTDKEPINLIYFQAHDEESSIILKWTTEFENNIDNFVIERSLNGIDFETIGQVSGAGFSSNAVNYTFKDSKTLNNELIFYRLQSNSFDGLKTQLNMIVAEKQQRIIQ